MQHLLQFLSDLFLGIYKAVVDAIAVIWPSTPDSLKLATIIAQFPSDSFAYFAIVEVAIVVATVIGLVAVYKLVKILPFT